MAQDVVHYLTGDLADADTPGWSLYSKIVMLITHMKQERAPAAQWMSALNALSQKGVKAAELETSDLLHFLKTQDPAIKVEKSVLLAHAKRSIPSIKRVDLAKPRYRNYGNISDATVQYQERLYILCSEQMVAEDAIEDLMYRIEALGFDPSPLLTDPDIVDRLEAEKIAIQKKLPSLFDFKNHHFSDSVQKHGKNLMAHARYSVSGDLFFIEEIQSDWAQKGRKNNWGAGYPKAPFVCDTEQWAGLVLRDLIQSAGHLPGIKRVAWINSAMRNGFANSDHDDLHVFYATIVRKLTSKAIEKAGGQVCAQLVATKHGPKEVLGFEMTDSVRQALQKPQPLYSRASVLPYSAPNNERTQERARLAQDCAAMLGNAHTIRFVSRLYDLAAGTEVAGEYFEGGIKVSLRAVDLTRSARHESWHFAYENFLLPNERYDADREFAVGTALNERTVKALIALGEIGAARQCHDPRECAAHAFALWCEKKLEVGHATDTLFARVMNSLNQISNWLEGLVYGVAVHDAKSLFEAMRCGTLAARAALEAERAAGQEADIAEDGSSHAAPAVMRC